MPKPYILGIGGPILDHVLKIQEEDLRLISGQKGGMEPLSFEEMEMLISRNKTPPTITLGGSARNTLQGLTRFGEKCALLGMIGTDRRGKYYRKLLENQGITSSLIEKEGESAVVLSLVTPDGERTMRTFQGVSTHLRGSDLKPSFFEGIKLLHLEGYTLYNEDLAEKAMALALDAGAKISFDLASFEIVRKFKSKILHLLENYVDIIFANETESRELTGKGEEESCDFFASLCEVGVVLMGSSGCFVKNASQKAKCPAYPVKPLDTTGAGDLFASGFLHAYMQGYPLTICAHYGAIAGRAVVQVIGAEIPHEMWVKMFDELNRDKF